MSVANICAVNLVALTKVVVRLLPLNVKTEPLTKLLPLMVSVKVVPPTVAVVGERVLVTGTGLLTVKSIALEIPPPGDGLLTVTGNTPAA